MKTAKKFMISLVFLTPVVLLTPTLLASCSYIPIDKKPDSGNVESPEITGNDWINLAKWEVLKTNNTYIQKDSNSKTPPVYLFKSGTKKDVYSIKDASDSIKKLVTNSIYAGNVLDIKTKSAFEVISSDFEKITSTDLNKSTYIKRNFDLTNQTNFNLINQFITKQKFTNIYSNANNQIEGETYLGDSIWFGNDKFQSISKILKCDVYVSLAETGNKSENIQYSIKFSFTTKNLNNWPGKNNNYPIEFEIQFETRNFLSLYSKHDINQPKNLPIGFRNSDENVITFYAGNLSKKSINSSKMLSNNDVLSYFSKDGTQVGHYPGSIATLLDAQVNTSKVIKAFSNLQATKIINMPNLFIDVNSDLSKNFNISKDNWSLPYVFGTDNSSNYSNKPIYTQDAAYIHRIDLSANNTIFFKIRHHAKNYKWFWGNWDEISNPYNLDRINPTFSDFEIWIKMIITE